MQKPPRPPGSQVAPRQRPLHSTSRQTATTHSRMPIAQATEGKLYRVRDRDWARVWGEDLTHADAVKLKEQVVTSGKSRTARVEEMAVPKPDMEGHDEVAPAALSLPQVTARAAAASRAAAAEAQGRHNVYRDRTVSQRGQRAAPPKDKTVMPAPIAPVAVELEPFSPANAGTIDGIPGADFDIHDLGLGEATEDDIAHAAALAADEGGQLGPASAASNFLAAEAAALAADEGPDAA